MNFILIAITGIAILAVLKTAGFFLKKIAHKYPLWKKFQQLLPLIEIIAWIAFAFWTAGVLFRDWIIYPYIMLGMALVVLVMFSWFVFRDVFAGAIFRAQNDLGKGDYIKIGAISGQVKSVHLTYLEITSDTGQTIKIPNARLNQDLISGMTTPEGMEEFTISLNVDKAFEKSEVEEKIRYEVANLPWCNYKNPPSIKFQKEDADSITYDVVVYTLNQQHLRVAERMLKEKFWSEK